MSLPRAKQAAAAAASPDPWSVYALIRGERWFAQKHRAASDVVIVDSAAYTAPWGATGRWLLLRVEPGAQTYSLTIAEEGLEGWVLTSPTGLLESLRRDGSLGTESGAVLRYAGPDAPVALDHRLLDAGDSSNTLFRMTLGQHDAVAKFFRRMDGAAQREVETLEHLRVLGVTPELYARLSYGPRTGAPAILASYMEFIDGEPAYRPFQVAARAEIAQAVGKDAATADVGDLCHRIGASIAAFHTAARRYRGERDAGRRLPIAERAAELAEKWRSITALTEAVSPLRDTVAARLARLAAAAVRHPRALMPSFGHGDLHLSHVILGPNGCRIIDPARSVVAPVLEDHALADLFQLYRGLECFAFDEAATWIERTRGLSREAASAELIDADPAGDTPEDRLKHFALDWPGRIFAGIVAGYRAGADPELSAPLDDADWCALFYLARLFHEVEYNIRYDRVFFQRCDRMFLQRFCAAPGDVFPPAGR